MNELSARSGCRLGLASLFFGVLALIAAAVHFQATHVNVLEARPAAVVLGLLDSLGLVHAPDMRAPVVLAPAYATSINDVNALAFLQWYAAWLGGWAVALALRAEAEAEDTLYLAVGLVLGCMAVLLLHPLIGISCLVAGGAAVLALRRRMAQGR